MLADTLPTGIPLACVVLAPEVGIPLPTPSLFRVTVGDEPSFIGVGLAFPNKASLLYFRVYASSCHGIPP
jgi:hypothetical protein